MSGMLQITTAAADKPPMLSPTLQFDVTSDQQQLLHAYQAQAASLKVTHEEFDGWLERVDQLSGVEVDQLTALHGQLIASGMLKFEISGRSIGLKYQLSQQGKKALEVDAVTEDDEDVADLPDSDLCAVSLETSDSEANDSDIAVEQKEESADTISAFEEVNATPDQLIAEAA